MLDIRTLNPKLRFHCLFHHDYEDRGTSSTGVLAVQSAAAAPLAIHFTDNAAQLSSSVTIYTQE